MNGPNARPTGRYLAYQLWILGGLLAVLLAAIGLDLPHYLSGAAPASLARRGIEFLMAAGLAVLVIALEVALIQKLRREIRLLQGVLSVCVECRRVHVAGHWESLTGYLADDSLVRLPNSICPECLKRSYPNLAVEVKEETTAEPLPKVAAS